MFTDEDFVAAINGHTSKIQAYQAGGIDDPQDLLEDYEEITGIARSLYIRKLNEQEEIND